MKTDKNILVAFLLNLGFSIFEVLGGILTNSVAIISDALHDFIDAFSIGLSYFLEKKSKKKPDYKYTYGYIRYSVLGALLTTTFLLVGSIIVIISAVGRLIHPVEIKYNGMIIISVIGIIVNFIAAMQTREGDSLNQKSVNLHMLEDVLGWVIVFIGSILMKFTDITYIDSIMSIIIAIYILIHAIKNLKSVLDLFLVKTPKNINIDELKKELLKVKNVSDIHHIHIWSMDGVNNYATIHAVINTLDFEKVKNAVDDIYSKFGKIDILVNTLEIKKNKKNLKEELEEHGIVHSTIEIEAKDSKCDEKNCKVKNIKSTTHHHH